MTSLRAAFVIDQPCSVSRIQGVGRSVDEMAGVTLEKITAGVADGLCVVAATLSGSPQEAFGWLTHLLLQLEGEDGSAQYCWLEIDGSVWNINASPEDGPGQ